MHRSALPLVALAACSKPAPEQPPRDRPETIASTPAPSTRSVAATPPAVSGGTSRYTSLNSCAVVESVPEEAGYSRAHCEGIGGFALEHVTADARQNLFVVAPGAEPRSLALSELAADGGFNDLGDRLEWRGEERDGQFRPDALIVRLDVQEGPQPGDTSYLVVARLTGAPCVTARVAPGPDQNARARAVADGKGACLPRRG